MSLGFLAPGTGGKGKRIYERENQVHRPLRRPHEADIHPACVRRRDEHRLLAGVAGSPRRRRDAVFGHPLRGSVHAAGAIQDLERSRASRTQRVGGDARCGGLREAEGGRSELEYRHVGVDDGAALHLRRRHAERAGVQGGGRSDVRDRDVDALDALHAVGMAARGRGVPLPDEPDVVDATARAHRGRIRGESVAREGDRLQAVAGAYELEMIAVVAGDAALVDVKAYARVRGYPGAEVRDADRDVIDARKNGRAYSAWIFARCTISRMRFK